MKFPPAKSSSRLISAIRADRESAIRSALEKGLDPNQILFGKHRDKFSLLECAVSNGAIKVARVLIKAGAKLDQRESPVVPQACNCHQPEMVELLLKCGADPNARFGGKEYRGDRGETALMYAAQWGERRVVKQLLKFGANPKAVTSSGLNVISFAVQKPGCFALVSDLIAGGCPVPKDILLRARLDDVKLVRLLLKVGADVNADTAAGESAECRTVVGKLIEEIHYSTGTRNPLLKVLDVVLKAGADLNRPHIRRTPLNLAVFYGEIAIVRKLLRAGAHPSGICLLPVHGLRRHLDQLSGKIARHALHEAAAVGNPEVVKLLVAAGGDLNARDFERMTPVEIARKKGKTTVVELLGNLATQGRRSNGVRRA